MARAYLIASAVALPLVIGFAVLANTVELPRGVIVAIYVLVIGVPVLIGAHVSYRQGPTAPGRHR